MRVSQIGEELHIVLSSEAIATLNATEGSSVDVTPLDPGHRYATLAEALSVYRATEPQHRRTYEELAK